MLTQQGDVLMTKVDEIPSGLKPKADQVVAEGEATGHRHVARGDGLVVLEADDTMYIDAPNGGIVVHEEHDVVTLSPGKFERRIVQEYDHFAEETREVRD
jgi:hypothetical protein|tara:strand:+ start:2703 stop:3002 length:300 start_codon:yes stop_codon:yes gene_type:complete